MAVYDSGELSWDTAEAGAPRWVLVLHHASGQASLLLDPHEASLASDAREDQLVALICRTIAQETGSLPAQVILTLVEPGQRYQFRVLYEILRG